jgi:hypothetical protein
MYNYSTKFKYFYNVLKEVYKIIEINWEMRDTDLPKLISIIKYHLEMYNSKNGIVRLSCNYDGEETLEISLSDYITGRGMKKLFKDDIAIKTILREKLIDDLLSDDEDIDSKLYQI